MIPIYNLVFTLYTDAHMALMVKTPENILLIQTLGGKKKRTQAAGFAGWK